MKTAELVAPDPATPVDPQTYLLVRLQGWAGLLAAVQGGAEELNRDALWLLADEMRVMAERVARL